MILSNGYLWASVSLQSRRTLSGKRHISHGEAKHSNVFVQGDWMFDYDLITTAKLRSFEEIAPNKVKLEYILNNEKYNRFIHLADNMVYDYNNIPNANYNVKPRFLTSFHFRKWKHLPNVKQNNIKKRKKNNCVEYSRKGLDRIMRSISVECKHIGKDFQRLRIEVSAGHLVRRNLKDLEFLKTLFLEEASALKGTRMYSAYKDCIDSLLKLQTMAVKMKDKKVTSVYRCVLAGYPTFPSVFGRDSDIANYALVHYFPDLVKENIEFRLNLLGKKKIARSAEEKGKALHELPIDELNNAGKLVYFPNYVGCDESSLLMISILRYLQKTEDLNFIKKNKSEIESLVRFIQSQQNEEGLIGFKADLKDSKGNYLYFTWNHTWRDSNNSIFHKDKTLPEQPLYMLWDQTCLFGMYAEAAKLSRNPKFVMFIQQMFPNLNIKIKNLKKQIEGRYWMEDEKAYALGLDKNYNKIAVVNSDVALGLYYRLFDTKRFEAMLHEHLENKNSLRDKFGIRTISKNTSYFDKNGYHTGSVWPWQNAFIAIGYQKYGHLNYAKRLLQNTIDVVFAINTSEAIKSGYKLPHSLERACEIQAWSASSIPLMIKEIK
ncbi:hypothetical protein DRJ17_03700 [Candidatus Woesearchaeota archaeon]|nr:MAG: hypothetical protein DRJ17_03700 [Candidatus Woesearchaeota archaeon]